MQEGEGSRESKKITKFKEEMWVLVFNRIMFQAERYLR